MIKDYAIWDPNLQQELENLFQNPNDTSHIILNSAIEYQYNFIGGNSKLMDKLIEFTNHHNIKLDIITGTHPSCVLMPHYSHVNIHYWPTFWLTMLLTRLKVSPNYQMNNSIGLDVEKLNVGKNLPILYPYICMSKAPKVHRAVLMDMLYKYDILNKGVVIWRESCKNYKYRYWQETIMLRDQIDGFKYQETLPQEYAMSFAQLVPESAETIFTMSEKTGMALYFNKPFLVAGSKNFHNILKDLSFVWYDELFDYSFDTIDDLDLRYSLIVENFVKLCKYSKAELKSLYLSVFDKCVYNKQVALRLATSSELIPKIWPVLVNHQIKNNIPSYPDHINNFILQHEHEHRL